MYYWYKRYILSEEEPPSSDQTQTMGEKFKNSFFYRDLSNQTIQFQTIFFTAVTCSVTALVSSAFFAVSFKRKGYNGFGIFDPMTKPVIYTTSASFFVGVGAAQAFSHWTKKNMPESKD